MPGYWTRFLQPREINRKPLDVLTSLQAAIIRESERFRLKETYQMIPHTKGFSVVTSAGQIVVIEECVEKNICGTHSVFRSLRGSSGYSVKIGLPNGGMEAFKLSSPSSSYWSEWGQTPTSAYRQLWTACEILWEQLSCIDRQNRGGTYEMVLEAFN